MDIQKRHIIIIGIILFTFFYFRGEEKNAVEPPPVPQALPSQALGEGAQDGEPEEVTPVRQQEVALTAPKPRPSQPVKYPNLDDSFGAFDEEGNRYVEQINRVGKHLVYHGDVLLGDEKDLPQLLKNKVLKLGMARKWPQGRIPYVIEDSVAQPEMVMEVIEYLNLFTNLKIVPREGEEDYVVVTRGDQDCYSYLGRIGGAQEMYLVPECGAREIMHEWMHVIGFFHEQNREDRDQYVQILWDNIDEVNHPQFKKLPNDYMGVVGRPFDFDSIMLYASTAFARSPDEPSLLTQQGEFLEPTQSRLSDEDILRINLAYPSVQ